MTPEQINIEERRLAQEREIAEQAHNLEITKHKKAWRIPLLVGATTIALSFVTNWILSSYSENQRQAQELTNAEIARAQFCYSVINDLVFRKPVIPGYSDESFDALVDRLAQVSDCEGRIERIAAFEPKSTLTPPTTTQSECQEITPIQSLGWRSGHKTNFCISRGFSGVHNPFGNYKSGGFCFKGEAEICISEIAKRLSGKG